MGNTPWLSAQFVYPSEQKGISKVKIVGVVEKIQTHQILKSLSILLLESGEISSAISPMSVGLGGGTGCNLRKRRVGGLVATSRYARGVACVFASDIRAFGAMAQMPPGQWRPTTTGPRDAFLSPLNLDLAASPPPSQSRPRSPQSNTSVVRLNLQDNWLGRDGGRRVCDLMLENCFIAELVGSSTLQA